MKYMFETIAVLALIVFTSPFVMAGVLGVPNTFTNGSTANADDVNANFNAVETEVNDNNSRIILNTNGITSNATATGANTGAISANTATIGANTGDITTNTGTIGANTGDITINTGTIGANTDDIGTLQNKISDSCPAGSSIRGFFPGGVDCVTAPTGANSVGQVELKDGLAGANWSAVIGPILIDKGGKTNLGSVTIQAPTSGVFVVSASGQMSFGARFKDVVQCGLSLNDANPGSNEWVSWVSGREEIPIILNRAFPVTAKENTIHMLCKRGFDPTNVDPDNIVEAIRADLTVVFVPVHYNPGNP